MRLLLTSDWQAEHSNLDLCAQALSELMLAAEKYKPDAIINAGDLKDAYNPADVRVIKFWVAATRKLKKAGHRFMVLLGNHDRISQAHESKDWLDILRAAGAETFATPRWREVGDGYAAFLPFTAQRKEEIKWSNHLLNDQSKLDGWRKDAPTVLLFHTEIQGAKLNAYGTEAKGSDVSALSFADYTGCFGGHLHLHQRVAKNAWYIGSPFCMDWGEANSTKGLLLADITPKGVKVTQLPTAIPGWYDATWLAANPDHAVEPGASIRCKVPVSTKKITAQLRAEEEQLKQQYGEDKRYFVVPQLQSAEAAPLITASDSVKEQCSQYVMATMPDAARFSAKAAIAYLTALLGDAGAVKRGQALQLVKLEAKDVLTFKTVSMPYHEQGLVLLRGKNRDWPKRSNGAGKTNCLSLLPVALFGQTLKGQKTDQWAREQTDRAAKVVLEFKDERGRAVVVERRRRPHGLQLWVDGAEQSSGLRGTGKQETQGAIEELCGFDYRLFLNAVYIDQSIANGFVFGTNKDRMDIVGKLQDLQRFDAAMKRNNDAIKKNEAALGATAQQVESLTTERSRLATELSAQEESVASHWATEAATCREKLAALLKEIQACKAVESTYAEKRTELDELKVELSELQEKHSDVQIAQGTWRSKKKEHAKLIAAGTCYVCGQPAQQIGKALLEADDAALAVAQAAVDKYAESMAKKRERILKLEASLRRYAEREHELEYERSNLDRLLLQAERGEAEEKKHNQQLAGKRAQLTAMLGRASRELRAAEAHYTALNIDRELLEYAKKACNRSGMPMHLSAALCPVLNNAAAEYSELLFNGCTNVQFVVRDGEFCVDVVNPTGSQTTDGQSVGEAAMAGIVTAFALREVAPKTNLLVLDEPGHGLDPEGARQFANGLLKLKDRFGTILLTTHSPIIESVLSGEVSWTVTKKKGISSLDRGEVAS